MSSKTSASESFIKPFVGQPGFQTFRTNYGPRHDKNFTVTNVNKSGKTIKVTLEFSKNVKTEHTLLWTRSKVWKEKGRSDDKWTHWHIGSHSEHPTSIPRDQVKSLSQENIHEEKERITGKAEIEDKKAEENSQSLTLVIGHGRKHQVIKELDYSNAVFVDRDKDCRPDVVADIKNTKNFRLDGKYDHILLANCETMILNVDVAEPEKVDNPLARSGPNTDVLAKLSSLLTSSGRLYLKPFKRLYKNDRISSEALERDLICSLSSHFEYVGKKDFTFGSFVGSRFVFEKVSQ